MAEASLVSILPQLSVGVVAVISLLYATLKHSDAMKEQRADFLAALDDRALTHEEHMKERENALRSVEREVRTTLSTHLTESTHTVRENTKVLERVVTRLDRS